jgi:hypothetical protein
MTLSAATIDIQDALWTIGSRCPIFYYTVMIPRFLARLGRTEGFRTSREYLDLRAYELNIPGVVFGAFAKYLMRIHEGLEGVARDADIDVAHQVLEALASAPGTTTEDLLRDEIFARQDGSDRPISNAPRIHASRDAR